MKVTAKHGTHFRKLRGAWFRVIDDTEKGLTNEEVDAIAEKASWEPIFWNDVDCYHWMFDFKAAGHWCEGLFREDVMEQFHQDNPFDVLNVLVYE